jgi:hypothetical protein
MTIELLIHAMVRQTMVLIAQLATSGGGRAPLAQVANQVFVDLVRELERQGVSRKVSADMFGLGLRTYRRKIQRLSESATERGRSLWEVVLEFIRQHHGVTRNDILLRFVRDDEAQVRAVLRDLTESQLVIAQGSAAQTVYRSAEDEELAELGRTSSGVGLSDLLLALMFREGPLTLAEIAARAQVEPQVLEEPLRDLVVSGSVTQATDDDGEVRFRAPSLVIPIGAPAGWEAALFDHFKAMVTTAMVRLNESTPSQESSESGGSTYTIDVWPGHPLENEVYGSLGEIRARLSDLRSRVVEFNKAHERPAAYSRVVTYAGQHVIREESDS